MRTVSPTPAVFASSCAWNLTVAADDLLVLRVALDHVDLDDDRLVALVGDDDAAALLAPAELGLRLLGARDRLARRRLLAHGLRARAARGARDVLARALLLGRRRRCSVSDASSAAALSRLGAASASDSLFGAAALGRRSLVGLGGRCLGLRRRPRPPGVSSARPRVVSTRLRRRPRASLGRLVLLLRPPSLALHFLLVGVPRSCCTVRMRAISRFASLRRVVFSSAPVAAWNRRLNSSCRVSASRCSQLVVGQVTQVPSPQRDHRPRASRTSS